MTASLACVQNGGETELDCGGPCGTGTCFTGAAQENTGRIARGDALGDLAWLWIVLGLAAAGGLLFVANKQCKKNGGPPPAAVKAGLDPRSSRYRRHQCTALTSRHELEQQVVVKRHLPPLPCCARCRTGMCPSTHGHMVRVPG